MRIIFFDLNEKGKNHFVQDIDEDTVSRMVQVADFFIEYAEKKQYGSLNIGYILIN